MSRVEWILKTLYDPDQDHRDLSESELVELEERKILAAVMEKEVQIEKELEKKVVSQGAALAKL